MLHKETPPKTKDGKLKQQRKQGESLDPKRPRTASHARITPTLTHTFTHDPDQRLTRKTCQIVLFHHDLVRKEQCSSICKNITPVLLLTLYLVGIHATCLIVSLSSFSVGEGSSKFWEKSLDVVWLTRDVIFVLLFAVSSATASFVEAMCELSVAC